MICERSASVQCVAAWQHHSPQLIASGEERNLLGSNCQAGASTEQLMRWSSLLIIGCV